ncbi:MAG: glycogen/starch/alpha-glucan phosphorylase [Clostridia bacterium]
MINQIRKYSVTEAATAIENKIHHTFGVSTINATNEEYYKAIALILKEMMSELRSDYFREANKQGTKKVYYLCMEFLLGRSLKNSLYNLGLTEVFRKALSSFNVNLDNLYEIEPDAGLGNGGLGRLAACFMDGFATQGYPAMGYSLRYEYGIFKQKLVDGWQTEMPDFWLPGGEVWLQKVQERAVEVKLGGHIEESWNEGYHSIMHKDATTISATPYDMFIPGMDGKGVSRLRIWKSANNNFDMNKFNRGDYLKAMEEDALAEAITKVLYPGDDHTEGKTLRLEQQYFLVSASIQDIIRRHLFAHSSLDNLPDLAAIHMNDTHPVLAIPEMMRIMLDECGYDWDKAWDIVTRTIAYTNHTVMAEALESWNGEMFKYRLPRIYQIVEEIDRRFWVSMREKGVDEGKIWRMAPINNGYVKMANLAVIAAHSVNGVSELHSEILKDSVFHDFYTEMPHKFKNVTNGIAHRRWLNQSNPEMATFLNELIGKDYIYDASKLEDLMKYRDDKTVLKKLEDIKLSNKVRLANHLKKTQGIIVDPNSLFDVQVKRLHEYKRQHMNALHILSLYQFLRDNPNADYEPHTFFFGAKAAPGYYFAKEIMQFIVTLGETINKDERVNKKLKIVFVENYCVSWAELLTPAAEISEQISLAGTEASGTSNMKFMINGAITLGTLDGANVEIHDTVGDDNMFLFGMTTPEVNSLKKYGYNPRNIYEHCDVVRNALNELNAGMGGKHFENIFNTIVNNDQYMALADFVSYADAQKKATDLYRTDKELWNKMSLTNIAKAGIFAADRAIRDYENTIWMGTTVK